MRALAQVDVRQHHDARRGGRRHPDPEGVERRVVPHHAIDRRLHHRVGLGPAAALEQRLRPCARQAELMLDRLVEHRPPLRRADHLVLAGAQDRQGRERLVEAQRRPRRVDGGGGGVLAEERQVKSQGVAEALPQDVSVRFGEPVLHGEWRMAPDAIGQPQHERRVASSEPPRQRPQERQARRIVRHARVEVRRPGLDERSQGLPARARLRRSAGVEPPMERRRVLRQG